MSHWVCIINCALAIFIIMACRTKLIQKARFYFRIKDIDESMFFVMISYHNYAQSCVHYIGNFAWSARGAEFKSWVENFLLLYFSLDLFNKFILYGGWSLGVLFWVYTVYILSRSKPFLGALGYIIFIWARAIDQN